VFETNEYCCRVCETHQDEIGREPSVHHITPRGCYSDDEWRDFNKLTNLISLCPSCHGTFEGEFTESSPEEFVEKAREEKY